MNRKKAYLIKAKLAEEQRQRDFINMFADAGANYASQSSSCSVEDEEPSVIKGDKVHLNLSVVDEMDEYQEQQNVDDTHMN